MTAACLAGLSNAEGDFAGGGDSGLADKPEITVVTIGAEWPGFTDPVGAGFPAGSRVSDGEFLALSETPSDAGSAANRFTGNAGGTLRIALTLPPTVVEGGQARKGYVQLSRPFEKTLKFGIDSYQKGQLSIPKSVVIPAGKTLASFSFSAADDKLLNLTRTVRITLKIEGLVTLNNSVKVLDDEQPPLLKLTLPATLSESIATGSKNALLTLDRPVDASFKIQLEADLPEELGFVRQIKLARGQQSVRFSVNAKDDGRIDGNLKVTLRAGSEGVKTARGTTTTLDNEARVLTLVPPATVPEGGTATGIVRVSGTMGFAVDVVLTHDRPGQITMPGIVTIPAGRSEGSFAVRGVDNPSRDGSRQVNLRASASTFTSGSGMTVVRDNEVASYRFSGLGDLVNVSAPVAVGIFGTDVEGNDIPGFSGAVNLEVVLPDGSVQPLVPGSVSITSGTGWAGNLTLPVLAAAPLKLRAFDGNANAGESNPFDVMRVLPMTAQNLVWDSTRSRLFASTTGYPGAIYSDQVAAIDPESMAVTGAVRTNSSPGDMVLTGGGEYLYQACYSNGFIYKIDPGAMRVVSQFAVGTDAEKRKLYAVDLCPVAGAPDVLLATRNYGKTSYNYHGVAVYDGGVMRPDTTYEYPFVLPDLIEPSSDPSVFYGFSTLSSASEFSRLLVSASGVAAVKSSSVFLGGFLENMKSHGDLVFGTSGAAVDGFKMKKLGMVEYRGLVAPDAASGRIFYLESHNSTVFTVNYRSIAAYDPTSLSLLGRLYLPADVPAAANFIRWGKNGIAYRTPDRVVLINSARLVPSDPPADLVTSVRTTPDPGIAGAPLTYTVQVTNNGANVAREARLFANLSDGQAIQSATSSTGNPVIKGFVVGLALGDLAFGETATLSVTVIPQVADSFMCESSASSSALDPNPADNISRKVVKVGFNEAFVVNELRLSATNLIHDPARNLLWASLPSTVADPLGNSVVSIDPRTGFVSEPIPLNAEPFPGSMALSPNGRYLYVGLRNASAVQRIDLESAGESGLRIPLALSLWGRPNTAQDIEVLDGDGTSFAIVGADDHSASVYDGMVMRTGRTGYYSVDRIEHSGSAGIFIGYNNYTSGFNLTRLSITAGGIAEIQNVPTVLTGYRHEIHNDGGLLLSSSGLLMDSGNLALKANLGASGLPCVDGVNQRVYLADGSMLRGYDARTGASIGTLSLPASGIELLWPVGQRCLRWGIDGFAILGKNGKILIARWPLAVPPAMAAMTSRAAGIHSADDPDADGIPNALEHLFGSSPSESSANPMKLAVATENGRRVIHLTFPRRAGMAMPAYDYEVSSDLVTWEPSASVLETVIATRVVDGVEIETVDAAITGPSAECGYVRLRWRQF